MIATADSALGQVSSLLNDIRGLVTEAANAGALSDEQIAANQLQVDSSLEALNRIAQTTTFQGRSLLDGSLDFITDGRHELQPTSSDLQIDQANLGATGSVAVAVDGHDRRHAGSGRRRPTFRPSSTAVRGHDDAHVPTRLTQAESARTLTRYGDGTLTFTVARRRRRRRRRRQRRRQSQFVDKRPGRQRVDSVTYDGTTRLTVTADFAGDATDTDNRTAIDGWQRFRRPPAA